MRKKTKTPAPTFDVGGRIRRFKGRTTYVRKMSISLQKKEKKKNLIRRKEFLLIKKPLVIMRREQPAPQREVEKYVYSP